MKVSRFASLGRLLPFMLIAFMVSVPSSFAQASRYALVIGNSNYSGMPKLNNPVNDATDLAAGLERLGFKVTLVTNANRKTMNRAIVAFREALAQDRQNEGVFFFAGHGVQCKGENYLIPVEADIKAEVDLDDEAVNVQKILGSLEEARNRVNLVILDACRDNPLPGTLRSAIRGLAVVTSAPPETLILYSTGAGQAADDGEGRNSPFSQALLSHIADVADITQVAKGVTRDVRKATGGRQTPYVYMGLSVDFALNNGTQSAMPAEKSSSILETAQAKPGPNPLIGAWKTIEFGTMEGKSSALITVMEFGEDASWKITIKVSGQQGETAAGGGNFLQDSSANTIALTGTIAVTDPSGKTEETHLDRQTMSYSFSSEMLELTDRNGQTTAFERIH